MGFDPRLRSEVITVVSGLPRSGTSMMMKMLEAGGLACLTDSKRLPDEDNPRGYYEFERVKKLPEGDCDWLIDARGKVVKVVSTLLEYLTTVYPYKIVYMQRNTLEVVHSQRQMLSRLRRLVKEADPEVVEEWKWRGVPVWSHDGLICTGETYKNVVKMTFAKGAALKDPAGLFNSSLEGNTRRAIDVHEGEKIDEQALKTLVRAAVALNTSAAKS